MGNDFLNDGKKGEVNFTCNTLAKMEECIAPRFVSTMHIRH